MADAFASPLSSALDAIRQRQEERMGLTATAPEPAATGNPFEDASIRYSAPSNVLQAIVEASGVPETEAAAAADRAGQALAAPLSSGAKMSDALKAAFPQATPEHIEAIKARALEIAGVAPKADAPLEGSLIGRRAQQFAAGAAQAVAGIPEALTTVNSAGLPDFAGMHKARAAELEAKLAAATSPAERRAIKADIVAANKQAEEAQAVQDEAAGPVLSEQAGYKIGTAIKEGVADLVGRPDPRDTGFWSQLATGAGQLGGMAAGAVIPGVGLGVAAMSGVGMTGRQMYDEAIAMGADEETARTAAQAGGLIGTTEMLPLSNAFKLLPASMRSGITNRFLRGAAKMAMQAGEEGAQEYLSQVAQNLVAQKLYDPERGWSEGATESAVIGAILGGALGAPAAVGEARRKNEQPAEAGGSDAAESSEAVLAPGPDPVPVEPDAAPGVPAAPDALQADDPSASVGPAVGAATAPVAVPAPVEPPAPAGPLEAAAQAGPLPILPDATPGETITIQTPEEVLEAQYVGEHAEGVRVRLGSEEMIVPREAIDSGEAMISRGAAPAVIPAEPAPEPVPGPVSAAATPSAPAARSSTGRRRRNRPEAPAEPQSAEEARQRLAFVMEQGRTNGWNGRLSQMRAEAEAAVARFDQEAAAAAAMQEPAPAAVQAGGEDAVAPPPDAGTVDAPAAELRDSAADAPAPKQRTDSPAARRAAKGAASVDAAPPSAVEQKGAETPAPEPVGDDPAPLPASAPTIEPIREKAALIRGIDQATADKLAADLKISVKPEKDGFVIGRKQADKVREALGIAEDPAAKPVGRRPMDVEAFRGALKNASKAQFDGATYEIGERAGSAVVIIRKPSGSTTTLGPGGRETWTRDYAVARAVYDAFGGEFPGEPEAPKPDSPKVRREAKEAAKTRKVIGDGLTDAERAAGKEPNNTEDPKMPRGLALGSVKKLLKSEMQRVRADPDASSGNWAAGDFHSVIVRDTPYAVFGGYGKTRAAAIADGIARAERAAAYGASNKLVTADRAAELRERLKSKLKDQLSAGIDPEILAIGTELAVFHIEAGARRFTEFAQAVANDLGTTPAKLRPYLRAWYNGARDMLEDGGHDASGMDSPDEVRSTLANPMFAVTPPDGAVKAAPAEKSAAPETVPAQAQEGGNIFTALQSRLMGEGFASISDARRFAQEITGEKVEAGTPAAKALDEMIETAVVEAADKIVREGKPPLETYRRLVDLYDRQPRLGVRTSDSIERQAYSTPAPLAYLASQLAGIGPGKTVYEPSAGNGMLLIGADRDKVFANEIDPDRAAALKKAGFDRVTMHDAALFRPKQTSDVVVTNPPFGPVRGADGKNKVFRVGEGYQTHEIDHAIVFNALDTMKDDGRAVLLIAGLNKTITSPEARSDAYNTKAKREFYLWLKRHYQVTDHFTVDGDLYAKQGAGWPIDVIVVEGRGEGSRPVPAVNLPQTFSSWAALEEKLGGTEADRSVAGEGGRTGGGSRSGEDAGRDGGGGGRAGGRREPASNRVEPVRQPGDGAASREPVDERRGTEPAPAQQPGRDAERPAPVARRAPAEGETQVPYKPASGAKSVDTLLPVNMAADVDQALASVRERRGDVDTFVSKELGIRPAALGKYFSAEQVDALALAIENIGKGAGFIIGDQTGIGKGRFVAGMMRYAMKRGLKPIFVTEKPNLYADMYRDMVDVGIPEMLGRAPVILPTNASLSIPLDESGEVSLKTGAAAAHDKFMEANVGSADVIFTTYTQMQAQGDNVPLRRDILQRAMSNAVLILDESHNAGGAGLTEESDGPPNRAEFVRAMAGQARAVVFSSATYAKRPDVMDLYAKTDMSLAVASPEMLGQAIAKGGIPMQQVVATMLSRSGQYLRRERSFKGINYGTVDVEVDRKVYDDACGVLDAIRQFSGHVSAAAKEMGKELKADGKAMSGTNSTGGAGVDSTSFSSVMHNLLDALLLSIGAEAGASRAIAALKDGRKPVLTVNYTMGSFLADYAADAGVGAGGDLDLTFARMFDRYLEKSREVLIRRPFMKKGEKAERHYMTDAELGAAGVAAFKRAKKMIGEVDVSGLPVSPIDFMRDKIRRAGYSVAEITGRSLAVDYSSGRPRLASVPSEEQGAKGRTKTVRDFNSGRLDAVILNQAGSTGLSLHASEKVKDQRPRRMLIVQASSNIDTHMQMLGRVNRTGQVVLPDYEQLAPNIPATIRPAAVLAKKMASLNANTTASRKSAVSDDSVDFLNEVGDKVVRDLVMEEEGLNEKLGDPVKVGDDSAEVVDDIARRVTGRLPLLPIAEQERIYAEIFRRYRREIEAMEARGESPLEAKTLDTDAVLVEGKEVAPKSGPSPFQEAVTSGIYDIKSPVKPVDIDAFVGDLAKEADVEQGEIAETLRQVRNAERPKLAEQFDSALESYKTWLAEKEGEAPDAEALEKLRERQGPVRDHFDFVAADADRFPPGSSVEIEDIEGGFSLYGFVSEIRQAGKALNPLAASIWEFKIQTNVGAITVPFSQIASAARPGQYQMRETSEPRLIEIMQKAGDRREKRTILTGNLLSAYEIAGGRGGIVNFTTREGEVKQGLMLPKGSELGSVKAGFRSGEQVVEHVSGGGTVNSTDGAIEIKKGPGRFRFEIAAAKAKGGRYYLNQGVRDAAGADFVSVGNVMRLDATDSGTAAAVADALKRAGASFSAPEPDGPPRDGGGKFTDSVKQSVGRPSPDGTVAVGARFISARALRHHFVSGPHGWLVNALIDAGRIQIHDRAAKGSPVQGATDEEGTIHLYAANLSPQTAVPVLLHEAFHAGVEPLIGTDAWVKLMGRVQRIYDANEARYSAGEPLSGWWMKAIDRMGPWGASAEELAAYAIEERAGAPAGLGEVIEVLLGRIKAFLLRRFGLQAGAVTPAQLQALAATALRNTSALRGVGPARSDSALRYSVAATEPTVAQVDAAERGIIGHALTKAMSGNYNLLALVPGRGLFAELAKHMPAAQEYLRFKQEMDATRHAWHARADEVAQAWRKLGIRGEGNAAMMDLMHDSTLAGVDPSKAFVSRLSDEDHDALSKGRRGAALMQRVGEDQALARQHADLQKRFRALPAAYRAMFERVRDTYKALDDDLDRTLLEQIGKAMDRTLRDAERAHEAEIARIRDEGLTGKARDEAIDEADRRLAAAERRQGWGKRAKMADLRKQFESQKVPEPYFPLARFGQFFVTVRDRQSGAIVSFMRFESPSKQAAAKKAAEADASVTVETGVLGEDATLRDMVDSGFVADVEAILGKAGVDEGVMDAVWQRWLETLPDLSSRKSRIHRKGTMGFSSDAFRAFGDHMFHGSHQLARLKWSMDMNEALDLAEAAAKLQDDPVRAGLIVSEMRKRHQFVMNPKGAPWAQVVTSAAFVYYLAATPAAALVNLTQTAIVGVPVLGAFGGTDRASLHLMRALRDFAGGRGKTWRDTISVENNDRLTADEKAAVAEAYRRSTIDASQAHDLAGVAESGVRYSAMRTAIMAKLAWGFHHTERLNREVTFLASYRLAREKGLSHMDAIDKASDLTWKTHFDYQSTSRPRFMQNDAAKALFVFRNFQVNMLWRLFRDLHQSINAKDAAERHEARAQLVGTTGMMALLSGATGVWGYSLVMTLAGMFFDDGKDEAEDEVQRLLVETLGTTAAGIVLKGVPGYVTGIDLTARIGMPDLWFRSSDRNLEGEDEYHYWVSQMLGAGAGMVESGWRGVSMMRDGEVYRGFETMAPKAARDLMRSYRYLQDGVTTYKGDSVIDDIDWRDLTKQAIGFTPARISERYDRNTKAKNKEARIMDERSDVMAEFARPVARGEAPPARAERGIADWNAEYPDYPIEKKNLKASISARRRSAARMDGGILLNPKLEPRIRGEEPPSLF